jgi:hypothetical protein
LQKSSYDDFAPYEFARVIPARVSAAHEEAAIEESAAMGPNSH